MISGFVFTNARAFFFIYRKFSNMHVKYIWGSLAVYYVNVYIYIFILVGMLSLAKFQGKTIIIIHHIWDTTAYPMMVLTYRF